MVPSGMLVTRRPTCLGRRRAEYRTTPRQDKSVRIVPMTPITLNACHSVFVRRNKHNGAKALRHYIVRQYNGALDGAPWPRSDMILPAPHFEVPLGCPL